MSSPARPSPARTRKFLRRFRIFDATMIHSKQRDTIVDCLGTHQHLAVDIDCSVDDDGAMCIRSGEERIHEGRLAFRFPLLFSGVADVGVVGRGRPTVPHRGPGRNKLLGPLFGYRGLSPSPSTPAPPRRSRSS